MNNVEMEKSRFMNASLIECWIAARLESKVSVNKLRHLY